MSNKICITPQIDSDHLSALLQAITSAEVSVLYQTPDLIYRWAENLPEHAQSKWYEGCRDSDFFPPDIAETMEAAKLQVLAGGRGASLELRLSDDDQLVWIKFSIDCHRDKRGKVLGIITTGVNVTELRRREQVLKILLREVSHRSKNLLAIMQSIAMQTARFSGTVGGFLKKFQGRIQSLSHSQDLVTDSNWRGALFQELVHSQANGYIDAAHNRFTIDGANPYLFPSAALHIGLAIHELIINSASYGALANQDGHVHVNCSIVEPDDRNSHIRISWEEIFPSDPEKTVDWKSRFGSTVLERIVPVSVNGVASYEINSGRVNYYLTMPPSQFDV